MSTVKLNSLLKANRHPFLVPKKSGIGKAWLSAFQKCWPGIFTARDPVAAAWSPRPGNSASGRPSSTLSRPRAPVTIQTTAGVGAGCPTPDGPIQDGVAWAGTRAAKEPGGVVVARSDSQAGWGDLAGCV